MRRPMVAGNWKMHGNRASVAELTQGLGKMLIPEGVEVAVFPPALFINEVIDGLKGKGIAVGAQNSAVMPEQGALTGEIAPSQLAEVGCKLVLIGHSERRQIIGEREEVLNDKFAAAQKSGLTPVLCIGETLAEREAGKTLEVVERQLSSVIDAFGIAAFANAVIAYEPVWAIGTGLTASPQQAQDVHAAIRKQLAAKDAEVAENVQLLYGGSVKAANAAELFGMPDIDGGSLVEHP